MRSLFNTQLINKAFLLIEIVGSFVIPTLTIVYVDASVLFGLYFKMNHTKAEELDLRRNISPRSQVPYYLQFGFNGVYLALFIYDKSTRPARRRVIESVSVDNHHLTERQREAQGMPSPASLLRSIANRGVCSGLVAVEHNSLCDSGIEDEPCRV
ncbi:hypothetical protein ANCDUO_08035 [Ancylostoma duodenale]|uniref:Uncharacterized protein n=1 Tax=Ancylostoma duodenale TaxID=51022 RepID=A0A0C2GX22_9BILA|nr:hypothetical protein ANCDUO_08035 [Ancylostoma duodenale]